MCMYVCECDQTIYYLYQNNRLTHKKMIVEIILSRYIQEMEKIKKKGYTCYIKFKFICIYDLHQCRKIKAKTHVMIYWI